MLTTIDAAITTLAQRFVAEPHAYFQEREVHSAFYSLCIDKFPRVKCQPPGAAEIGLFRQEYDTIWKYIKDNGYSDRYADRGTTACIDFVVLDPASVASSDFLTVVNKDEVRRQRLRSSLGGRSFISAGIEFKMAHLRTSLDLSAARIGSFGRAMVVDARKLAHERIANSYLVGFLHGKSIRRLDAWQIVTQCQTEFHRIFPEGAVSVYLIAAPFDQGIYTFDPGDGVVGAAGPSPPSRGSVCWFEGSQYFLAGEGKDCRILPLVFDDRGYFPPSKKVHFSHLTNSAGAVGHDLSRVRPKAHSKYLWEPPPGEIFTPPDETQQPAPPRRVTVTRRGGGETSRVVDEDGRSFRVFTHHLLHSRLS